LLLLVFTTLFRGISSVCALCTCCVLCVSCSVLENKVGISDCNEMNKSLSFDDYFSSVCLISIGFGVEV
jgi:hypothetical protein